MLTEATTAAVRDAAAALRRTRRLTGPEMGALVDALQSAETELRAIVQREYPGLYGWLRPAPSHHRWDARAQGWVRWSSAVQMADAAERWLDEGPAYAAARVGEAYGLGATLSGEANPALALRSYGRRG